MSITAECTSCGRRYQAPDNMAGKRVRCKQCGNIFSLPESSGENLDLEALGALEGSYHSVDATGTGEESPNENDSNGDGDEASAVTPLRRGRTNVRFSFPFAREIDRWLPTVLTLLGLVWLVVECINFNETSVKWMPYVRLAVALLAFYMFIGPITLAMIRKAGHSQGYQMPSNDRGRAFGIFLPVFVLGCVMWAAGDGQVVAIVLGSFIGIVMASGALWLLFRLNPTEIAPTAIYSLIGYFIGLGLVSGIFYGLNLLLVQVLVSVKMPDVLPASPFGSGFAWITEDQRKEIQLELAKKPPTPSRDSQSAPSAGAQQPPSPPQVFSASSISPIVRSVDSAQMGQSFGQIIYPLTNSSYRALSRASGSNTTVELWASDPWAQKGTATFNTADANKEPQGNRYVLSPDGRFLARIALFPRLSAQIWSFSDHMSLPVVSLNETLGQPELIGFVDAQRLLVHWQRDNSSAFQIVTVSNSQPAKPVETQTYDSKSSALAISPQGNLAAIATRVDGKAFLMIYSLDAGKELSRVAISLDPRWPVKPTGMAFSFDSRKLAAFFEQDGNALVLGYQVDPDKGLAAQTAEHVYLAGDMPQRDQPFMGNALSWLPDGKSCILYGQSIFDIVSGRKLDELHLTGIQTAHVSPPNLLELSERLTPDSPPQILTIRLDMDKITSLAK